MNFKSEVWTREIGTGPALNLNNHPSVTLTYEFIAAWSKQKSHPKPLSPQMTFKLPPFSPSSLISFAWCEKVQTKGELAVWPRTEQSKVYADHNVRLLLLLRLCAGTIRPLTFVSEHIAGDAALGGIVMQPGKRNKHNKHKTYARLRFRKTLQPGRNSHNPSDSWHTRWPWEALQTPNCSNFGHMTDHWPGVNVMSGIRMKKWMIPTNGKTDSCFQFFFVSARTHRENFFKACGVTCA